jgi:hypothetical protein
MLLLSTVIYINEAQKNAPIYAAEADVDFAASKQAVKHTVVSALANITNSGNVSVLADSLEKLKSVLTANSYNAIFGMQFAALNASSYQEGIWTSWGPSGAGISSAYVGIVLNASGPSATQYSQFAVNVTTNIVVSGDYVKLNGTSKQVNVTFTLSNEDKQALAESFTVYYEYNGSLLTEEWIQATSPTTVDYGNGTYLTSFTGDTFERDNPVLISVHCQDTRGIFVWANATATER